MPPEQIREYLKVVESLVQALPDVYVEKYEEEILAAARANLRLRIRFQSGAMLEVNEAIALEDGVLEHLGYRYHFQDDLNQFVFRYDNTPHFPDLLTFPDHKHTKDRVQESNRPPLSVVFEEALWWESERA